MGTSRHCTHTLNSTPLGPEPLYTMPSMAPLSKAPNPCEASEGNVLTSVGLTSENLLRGDFSQSHIVLEPFRPLPTGTS